MPTLSDLRTRIITDTSRSDLAGGLANRLDQAIQRSIDRYSNQRFYFSESRSTGTIPAGQRWFNLPTGVEHIDRLYVVVGAVEFEMTPRSNAYLEDLYMVVSNGQPTDYALMQNGANFQVQVWPTPNVSYPSVFLTISDTTALDYNNPASSSFWTNDGFELIAATAEAYLYRSVFRDSEGYAMAEADRLDAIGSLQGSTNSLLGTGRIRPSW